MSHKNNKNTHKTRKSSTDSDRRKSRDRSNSRSRSRSKERYDRQGQSQWKSLSQQTKTLCIEMIECPTSDIQQPLTQISLEIGTSMPDEVQLRNGNAYVKYPSSQASSKTLQLLKGKIIINSKQYRVDFYPSRKVDLNVVQDWYCDKCEYKNFARRNKCNRCDNARNHNCKIVFNSAAIIKNSNFREEPLGNCSLMVRGPVVMRIEQEHLLDIFSKFSPVKDIRMIRNRMTGMYKDFAFIEFYSQEETTTAYKAANTRDFRIEGEEVNVYYSKTKRQDKDYSKYQDELPPPPRKSKELPDNYCKRQRQREIREQKEKPIVTMEQLKEKKQAQIRKNAQNSTQKQLTAEKIRRKRAELDLKKWEKQMKTINQVLYICPICVRKFKDETELKNHQQFSEIHKEAISNLELAL